MERFNRHHPGLIYKISFLFAFVATFTFFALKAPQDSQAASLANFRPGNIISDYTMSNYTTMSVADIDAFLHAHGNCNDINIVKASWYPSLHYHIENGHFVCLADERFAVSGSNYGDLLKPDEASQTAAEIIYEVSQEYKINPQVFIVLLEKEQGLISDSWPNSIQYRAATGFGCPDTAPCDSEYYGLKNQLESAAWLFRTVLDGGWTNYPVGENYIYYNPNRACGGSVVNIENLATSSLYRYTPYQPNQAALDAGYGTVTCGAYGNRNFYLFFMDWFGDPTFSPERAKSEYTAEEVLAQLQKVDAENTDLDFEYSTHVQKLGWMEPASGGEMAGTTGFSLRMEAFKVSMNNNLKGIEYRSYIQEKGWETTYKQDGDISGTTGESLRIEGIQIRLHSELADDYDILYRTHIQKLGWTEWAKNDEVSGAPGEGLRIEAVQIKIIEKDPGLRYTPHVQTYGWLDWVKDGELAGTTGESKRLEAIKIALNEEGIKYTPHVQTYGWLDWVKDGELAGTTGESKRLEAIKIELYGDLAKEYSIYYRAHVQTYGWLDWVKDGELAGTTGESKRLEAIEIKLVAK